MINKLITLFTLTLMCGCISIKPNKPSEEEVVQTVDVNCIKTQEKTYKIAETQDIYVYDEDSKTKIKYDSDWFIVHSDLLKLCNENQNYIINTLQKDKSSISTFTKITISILSILSTILIIIMTCLKKKS